MRYYTTATSVLILVNIIYWLLSNIGMINQYLNELIGFNLISALNTGDISYSTIWLVTTIIPLVSALLILIGFLALNIVFLDENAAKLVNESKDKNIKEMFIIIFFKKYASFIEFLCIWLTPLSIIGFSLYLIIYSFYTLAYTLALVIDSIFDTKFLLGEEKNIINNLLHLLIPLAIIYIVLFFKNIYALYVKTNFPIPFAKKINVMFWLDELHARFKNEKHIALVFDKVFQKNITGDSVGVIYYIKKFELGSVARVLVASIIKGIFRVVYFITRPLLILLKAKYFYYLLYPIIFVVSFSFNFLFSFAYNGIIYLFSFITSLVYHFSVLLWIGISIVITIYILIINTIALNFVIVDYTNIWYLFSNAIVFILFNTISAAIVYTVLPEYKYYYNLSIVKRNFERHILKLDSKKQKISSMLFTTLSVLFLMGLTGYFIYEFILIDDLMQNFDEIYNLLEQQYKLKIDEIMEILN